MIFGLRRDHPPAWELNVYRETVLITILKLSKAKDTRAQIDNSADFSERQQRIYTSSNQSLKNEKKIYLIRNGKNRIAKSQL